MKSLLKAIIVALLSISPAITAFADTVEPLLMKPASIKKLTIPDYPPAARQFGIEGTVIVEVLVGTDGKAHKYKLVKPDHPLLNSAAISAAMNAQYNSAQMPSGIVSCWVKIPFNFKMNME